MNRFAQFHALRASGAERSGMFAGVNELKKMVEKILETGWEPDKSFSDETGTSFVFRAVLKRRE